MRICFYSHDAYLYGASKSLLNLISAFKEKRDVQVLVILPENGPIKQKLDELDVECVIIKNYWWASGHKVNSIYSLIRYIYHLCKRCIGNILSLKNHYKFLRSWKPDIIYTNTGVIPMGFIIAKFLNIKHVWHLREFIDIDHNLKLDFGFVTLRHFLNNSNLIFSVSDPVKRHIIPKPKVNVKTVANGICNSEQFNERFECWRNKSSASNLFTFSIIGFVSNSKGQYDAIEAFSKLALNNPNVRLIIAGHGGGDSFSKYIFEKNYTIKGKIEFLGHVESIDDVYLQTNCLLMCSKNEAFGRVTVEGMSYGIPVIGYDNMGTSEIITDHLNGFLYGKSFKCLEKVMSEVVTNYDFALDIGFIGWQTAKNRYSQEIYFGNVFSEINKIIN